MAKMMLRRSELRLNNTATNKQTEENDVSMFDSLVERELPEAFKKNAGRFKLGSSGHGSNNKLSFFKKTGSDDDNDNDNDGTSADCGEAVSIFDAIVQEEKGSLFDALVEQNSSASLFDSLVESSEQKTPASQSEASWDDRVARTLLLSEELVAIRASAANK